MKNIILCPNPLRDRRFEYTLKLYKLLEGLGEKPVICPLFEKYGSGELPNGIRSGGLEDSIKKADLIIAFGGDGTILTASRFAAPCGVPVMGVNLGHKGFIAEFEKEDTELILSLVKDGFKTERRMMLDVALIRRGKTVHSDFLLNDVVISGIARMIDVSVFGDDHGIFSFSGDGVVIATPTGSTAYSMSAGGPVVEPETENIIITPICAHALRARSMVLAAERVIEVEVGRLNNKSAYMAVDGGASIGLMGGDIIKVSKSSFVTEIVRVSGRDFYKKVSEKFGEKL